ncbi:MAG: hypothetical protein IPJ65_10695 [Archangiaceae bacterium]|nr:hypothetical protein [Archangiaceae bacterium]
MSTPEELFEAARTEAPSAAAKAKAAAALQVGAATATAAGTGALATGVKVVGVVLLAGAAFVGGMQFEALRRPPVAPIVVQLPAPPPALPPAQPVVEPLPPPEVALPQAPAPKPRPKAAPAEDELTRELAAVDRARTHLRDHDAAAALVELDAYERAFPHPALGTEARLLRIDALLKAGRRPEAERLGQAMLGSDAPAPVKQRVQRLLDAQ